MILLKQKNPQKNRSIKQRYLCRKSPVSLIYPWSIKQQVTGEFYLEEAASGQRYHLTDRILDYHFVCFP
jgi:hypothetical protein